MRDSRVSSSSATGAKPAPYSAQELGVRLGLGQPEDFRALFELPTLLQKLNALETLWFNTGTLCNLTCANCYIESSPRNDRLDWLSLDEVRDYLDEIAAQSLGTRLIGFTGGEPFMNRDIIAMLELTLSRGLAISARPSTGRP